MWVLNVETRNPPLRGNTFFPLFACSYPAPYEGALCLFARGVCGMPLSEIAFRCAQILPFFNRPPLLLSPASFLPVSIFAPTQKPLPPAAPLFLRGLPVPARLSRIVMNLCNLPSSVSCPFFFRRNRVGFFLVSFGAPRATHRRAAAAYL